MKLNRYLHGLLERLDEVVRVVRLQKSRHILQADGISAHLLELLCVVGEILGRVDRTGGVADRRLNMTAFLLGRVYSGLKVSRVVESIENSQDIDAVRDRLLDEVLNHVVSVVTVAEDILSAEKHLELRILDLSADLSESLPRILVKESHAGVESSAAPRLERMIADLIELIEDRQHLVGRHTRRDQGLMRVTQDGLGNFNLCHLFMITSVIC